MEQEITSLTGKLLIAMPGMGDPRFEKAVILLCRHGEAGAMGLIVNRRAPDLTLDALLEQLSIPSTGASGVPLHHGGPVEGGRGFVLHTRDYSVNESTLWAGSEIGMTATLDILRDIAAGKGPDRMLVALGYAGWGPGQLEAEIAGNVWLVSDGRAEIVFAKGDADKWRAAVESLGIDPLMLSGAGGRA
ncbi:hypothetical protein OCGS_2066 [Oceaniovalibus guishaninsula JLT2003]|uniref:UPF0301 protein OCGS_2066 n=1 Tax=Oceaniovalibus guishaninsula JLT2003 TaxID=1231392 RepID=K2HAP2_9RHOB|nr:YqgE/AlgH family protein [Oceaniovalibus guishaninsula]EKE43732.1 hypothetical protein OCGS_2066 [Oceaniovalibus guishaninsula JLT2003]